MCSVGITSIKINNWIINTKIQPWFFSCRGVDVSQGFWGPSRLPDFSDCCLLFSKLGVLRVTYQLGVLRTFFLVPPVTFLFRTLRNEQVLLLVLVVDTQRWFCPQVGREQTTPLKDLWTRTRHQVACPQGPGEGLGRSWRGVEEGLRRGAAPGACGLFRPCVPRASTLETRALLRDGLHQWAEASGVGAGGGARLCPDPCADSGPD